MQVQSYAQIDPATLPSADEGTDAIDERIELLREMGFTSRLKWETSTAPRLETANLIYPELLGKDLKLWARFLPTRTTMSEFMFDAVPTEALRQIQDAQKLGCFDQILIWTPARNRFREQAVDYLRETVDKAKQKLHEVAQRLDPMAVGVIKDSNDQSHFYPIVRWGEALLPVQEVKQHVRAVHRRLALTFMIVPLLAMFLAVASYVNAIHTFGYLPVVLWTFFIVFIVAVLAVVSEA